MSFGAPDPRDLGRFAALTQLGLEMVAPIVLGLVLDSYFGWSPWAVLIGVALGFFGGMAHLLLIVNRQDRDDQRGKSPAPKPPASDSTGLS